jgi:hypothetical protein
MPSRRTIFLTLLTLAITAALSHSSASANDACTPPTTITRFPIKDAIGVKWNAARGLLAFGRPGQNNRFDIWLSDRDGGSARRLTNPAWNDARHQFPIAWHPSGDYLVVLVEKSGHGGNGWDATPGYGAHSDYWIVKPDGTGATLLVESPDDNDHALTHAAFSPDGSKFAWTQRIKGPKWFSVELGAGSYEFDVADFVAAPTPHLENVRRIVPGGKPQGGEIESMTDNRTILFYSTLDTHNMLATPIYSMDIESGVMRRLTTESFAQTPTPTADGKRIIYMTAADSDVKPAKINGADWWIMDLDGSHKQRLTSLSVQGSSQSNGGRQLAGSLTVIDDHTFYGDVLTKIFGLVGYIVKVEITPGCVSQR